MQVLAAMMVVVYASVHVLPAPVGLSVVAFILAGCVSILCMTIWAAGANMVVRRCYTWLLCKCCKVRGGSCKALA
jgi:hypothetical protein